MAKIRHRYTGMRYEVIGDDVRVKHRDFFSMKNLYIMMHEWLVIEGWATRKDPDFPERLYLRYLDILKRGWEKFARQVMQEKDQVQKALAKQLSGLRVTEDMVEELVRKISLNPEKPNEWTDDQMLSLARELRKRTKPMLIACNKIDVDGAMENYERLKKEFPDEMMIPCSAESELALREAAKHELIKYIPGDNDFEILQPDKLNEKQTKALEYIRENVLKKAGSTGVQQVLDDAVFKFLKYIAIYPGGVGKLEDSEGRTLPDCFLLPPGSTALDFAFKLHTDFGKHFIKAINVKTKLPVGKDQPLNHRDVIEIKTNK